MRRLRLVSAAASFNQRLSPIARCECVELASLAAQLPSAERHDLVLLARVLAQTISSRSSDPPLEDSLPSTS